MQLPGTKEIYYPRWYGSWAKLCQRRRGGGVISPRATFGPVSFQKTGAVPVEESFHAADRPQPPRGSQRIVVKGCRNHIRNRDRIPMGAPEFTGRIRRNRLNQHAEKCCKKFAHRADAIADDEALTMCLRDGSGKERRVNHILYEGEVKLAPSLIEPAKVSGADSPSRELG